MIALPQVIDKIIKSKYFEAWQDELFSYFSIAEWEIILGDKSTKNFYDTLGLNLFSSDISYVIITEYIDEVNRYVDIDKIKCRHVKNSVAKAYLHHKLIYDKKSVSLETEKKLSTTLEAKRDLINAHLLWMGRYIAFILEKSPAPELDHTLCTVGKWILEEGMLDKDAKIVKLHTNLHAMSQSAIRMYRREDYAYFLLLYIDILNSSYQIRDLIMNIYFIKKLVSINVDYLTDQANYFQLIEDVADFDENHLLLLVNIQEFSKINMLYGHEIGDALIKEVMNFCLSREGICSIYRIYGDEFALVFKSSALNYVKSELKRELEEHEFHIQNRLILLNFYGSFTNNKANLLEYCEYGLILSKNKQGNFIDVTDIEETEIKQYASRVTLKEELNLAFMDGRIVGYYQPIFDVKQQKITKYEVLMRLIDLEGKVILPAEFLPALTKSYIYPEVTKMMIKNSFEFFEDKEYEFSLNLSFADIANIQTQSYIQAIIKKYPSVAPRCTFELLETEAIENKVLVQDFFAFLHQQGVKISIDDFGTGFSNYDMILSFDVDYIKVDGSIVESMLTNEKSKILLSSIVQIAIESGAKVIVEYVSSKELYDILLSCDIDYMQGYYIGRPQADII